MTTSECMSFIYIPALCIRCACTFLTYGHATPPSSVRRRSWRPSNVVHEVGQAFPAAPARQHGDAVGARPVVGGGVGHHDRRAGGTDAGGDGARDGVAGADAEQGARRARGWSWRCRRRRGAGSASRKPLVVATVVYVVETTSQLVHVPSSATTSGGTTVAQVVQLQVATFSVTALQVPTQSRERAAQAVGRGVAGADAEQGARSASRWSWRCRRRRGAGSASRKPLVVAAVVYVVETTSQLVHVPSSATASGVTTVAQVVQLQVATLRVTASPLPTRNREHVAQAVGRGGRVSAVEMGGSSWQEGVAVVDKVWLPR